MIKDNIYSNRIQLKRFQYSLLCFIQFVYCWIRFFLFCPRFVHMSPCNLDGPV